MDPLEVVVDHPEEEDVVGHPEEEGHREGVGVAEDLQEAGMPCEEDTPREEEDTSCAVGMVMLWVMAAHLVGMDMLWGMAAHLVDMDMLWGMEVMDTLWATEVTGM